MIARDPRRQRSSAAFAAAARRRGRPRRCLDAFADFAWAEREAIAEIDVNPIMVLRARAGLRRASTRSSSPAPDGRSPT